ncbi:hypothetical protein F4821DRAFT_251880 [Hypoxylon rubiginosum]|uniref:Uncharacterized protein n=1 Tax=Hypoxylon rubiginosum TaxID=110542 RepID=A0ACC0CIS3_9PEZI|nr:hypothetical protein F4821DRAFT_251880 [Hypoxylon rubiginosum]
MGKRRTWHAATSTPTPTPTRPQREHGANEPSDESRTIQVAPPTLGNRFHALLPELRDEIFAWLLVRPVKWDAEHTPTCLLRITPDPYQNIHPRLDTRQATCALLYESYETARWRRRRKPIFVDPWRSQWAPAQGNPFLCTICYDREYRLEPFPRVVSLPCLCARRQNLDTLLVCRRWYEEAGRVFYTRNTFAFGSAQECVDFLANLSPRWQPFVSKASLLALAPRGVYPETAAEECEKVETPTRSLEEAWSLLGQLPGLSELELDAILLTRLDCVRVLRKPALKSLGRISFTQAVPQQPRHVSRMLVWPRRGIRKTVEDSDFARRVARAIRGQRLEWVEEKEQGDDKAVTEEKERYCTRIRGSKRDEARNE